MGEWKQTDTFPKRMQSEIKAKKWCGKCGARSHNTSEHDKIQKEKAVELAPSVLDGDKILDGKHHVKATRVPTKQKLPTVSDLTLSKRQCKRLLKPVLTHKRHRQARKCFLKRSHVPGNPQIKLLYRVSSAIDANPTPTNRLKWEWEELDAIARKKFNASSYDILSRKNKRKVIEMYLSAKDDTSVTSSVSK